jgi:hypothetical protein
MCPQAGPLSEAASSRPGSLYQEQVSPLSFAAADLSPLPPAGDGEETPWRTPSASPSPPATAAAANGQQGLIRSADATPRRAGRDTGAAAGEVGGSQQHSVGVSPRVLRSSGEGQLPSGFFTPIETRVQSLASKLRVRDCNGLLCGVQWTCACAVTVANVSSALCMTPVLCRELRASYD